MLRRLALATACIAAASMAIVSTASARTVDQARKDCADGHICLYEHVDWEGRKVELRLGATRLSELGRRGPPEYGFNDKASSYINDSTDRPFCLYQDELNGNPLSPRGLFRDRGPSIKAPAGAPIRNLVAMGWNDRISAVTRTNLFGDCV